MSFSKSLCAANRLLTMTGILLGYVVNWQFTKILEAHLYSNDEGCSISEAPSGVWVLGFGVFHLL